jgi:hypothetical protein
MVFSVGPNARRVRNMYQVSWLRVYNEAYCLESAVMFQHAVLHGFNVHPPVVDPRSLLRV